MTGWLVTSPGSKWLKPFLDAVFPRFCVNCNQEGELLCRMCMTVWQHEPPQPELDQVAFFAYANPVVRKLICAWKYDYDQSAFELLKTAANEVLPEFVAGAHSLGVQAVVPLPLSDRRLCERGFNQSQLIAAWIAAELGVPVLDVLARTHRRGHQAERTDEERQRAMSDSPFLLINPEGLPQTVLLVDDVWTTGATMQAAKRVLEANGKTRVFALTLAKG